MKSKKVVFGPVSSFYDDRDFCDELQVVRESDGVFIEIILVDAQIAGVTLVKPQIEELIKVLKKELKRLS